MTKVAKQKQKKRVSTKKRTKAVQDRSKTAEYVGCLIELHKLQGLLLSRLRKQI